MSKFKKNNKSSLHLSEVKVTDNGFYTSRIFSNYPLLQNNNGLKQKFEIFKPGNTEAIIVFPGKLKIDTERFKRGQTFKQMLEVLDQTIILVNWPEYSYIPELAIAQLTDLCLAKKIQTIKIFGTSYGGYCGLELIENIKRNKIPIKINGLVTILSPASFSDIRFLTRLRIQAMRVSGEFLKYNAAKSKNRQKTIAVANEFPFHRKGALLGNSFTKKELTSNIPVLAVTTKGIDLLINNNRAASKLKKLFDRVEILQVKGTTIFKGNKGSLYQYFNFSGAHGISADDFPRVQDKILEFLAQ